MASRALVNSYLRSAWAAEPADNGLRIAFLEGKAAELDAEIQSGDWAVGSTSFDGASHSASRGITALERLEAIQEAIELLTEDPEATKKAGGFVIPRFHEIPVG